MGGESPHPFRARQPGSEGRSRGTGGHPLTGGEHRAERDHAAGSAERTQPRGRCLVVGLSQWLVGTPVPLPFQGECEREAGRDGDRKALQPSTGAHSAVQDRHHAPGARQGGARDAGDRGAPADLPGQPP